MTKGIRIEPFPKNIDLYGGNQNLENKFSNGDQQIYRSPPKKNQSMQIDNNTKQIQDYSIC